MVKQNKSLGPMRYVSQGKNEVYRSTVNKHFTRKATEGYRNKCLEKKLLRSKKAALEM